VAIVVVMMMMVVARGRKGGGREHQDCGEHKCLLHAPHHSNGFLRMVASASYFQGMVAE
jgi:hypothetical protein